MKRALLPWLLLLPLLAAPALAAQVRSLADAARALQQPGPLERARALVWLGRQQEPRLRARALVLLAERLADRHPAVRRAAWNGLGAQRAQSMAERARVQLAAETDQDVLPAALIALGRIGSAESDAARIDAFADHPSPAVRVAALTALAALRAPRARVRAQAFLKLRDAADPTWAMRAAALLALADVGTPADAVAATAIYAARGGRRAWLARSAYARLVAAKSPGAVATLSALVRDPDPRVAVTAARGLVTAGHPSLLLHLLRAPEAQVRAVAIAAVAQAQLRAGYDRLRRMARADTSRPVRWAAAKALWHLRDPLGTRLLLLGVGSHEPAIWAEAIALLARRTGADHGRDVAAWRRELR